MSIYEKPYLARLIVGTIAAVLGLANPLNMPPEPYAQADVIEVLMPVLVDRTPEAAKAYAQTQLSSFGWNSPKQWACLEDLWTGESNWRPAAFNKKPVYQNGEKLHAGGIPQILGLDPDISVENQIERGFKYIQFRYDTPCSANNFWNRNFWY